MIRRRIERWRATERETGMDARKKRRYCGKEGRGTWCEVT